MTEQREDLTDRPALETDATVRGDLLSQVLASVRLEGERIFTRMAAPSAPVMLDPHDAPHLFIVTEGSLGLHERGNEYLGVEQGDLVLLPHGQGGAGLSARNSAAALVVCRFRFDPEALRGMLFALPRAIHIRQDEAGPWLAGLRRFLLIEVADDQPGASLMISRLIDLLVIRALRSWIHSGAATGWLRGLSDPRIARVLKALHEKPLQRWSLASLADIAGMSRSSFSGRFTQLVGNSPLRYQNEGRLAVARRMLKHQGTRVSDTALAVGYESEAAFSRAYSARFGHPPRAERLVLRDVGQRTAALDASVQELLT